jgi:hypothetical protein
VRPRLNFNRISLGVIADDRDLSDQTPRLMDAVGLARDRIVPLESRVEDGAFRPGFIHDIFCVKAAFLFVDALKLRLDLFDLDACDCPFSHLLSPC